MYQTNEQYDLYRIIKTTHKNRFSHNQAASTSLVEISPLLKMCSSGTARTGSWKFLCVECGFLNREKGVAKSNEKFDCCDSFGLGTNLSNHSARDYIRTYRRKMVFRNRRFVGCLSGNDAASPAHAPLASNFLLSVLSRAVADTAFVKLGYKYNQKLPRRDRDPFLVTAAVSTACDSLNYRATSTSNPPQAVHTANLPNSFSATRQQCICPADLGRRSLMREQEDSKSSLQGEVRIYNKAMKPHIPLHSLNICILPRVKRIGFPSTRNTVYIRSFSLSFLTS
jgi:hypothetical protein